MTLNEFLFDSVENFESIYIDYNDHTKELTPALYDMLESCEVLQWYLDIKQYKPCIIIKIEY